MGTCCLAQPSNIARPVVRHGSAGILPREAHDGRRFEDHQNGPPPSRAGRLSSDPLDLDRQVRLLPEPRQPGAIVAETMAPRGPGPRRQRCRSAIVSPSSASEPPRALSAGRAPGRRPDHQPPRGSLRRGFPEVQCGARASFRLQKIDAMAVAGEHFYPSVRQRIGEHLLLR